MKKGLFLFAPLAFILSACATDGTMNGATGTTSSGYGSTAQQLGMTAIKIAVNAKYTTELNQLPAWKMVSKTLTSDQQQTVQSNICDCVSDKAPESVTAVDLATAALDPAARTTIASNAVSRTINQCVAEALK